MAKILMVVTGSDVWTLADGTAHPSGYWAEEVAAPYQAFVAAGYDVVVATPGGVAPTMDPASLAPELNGGQENADAIAAVLAGVTELKRPVALADVELDDYAGVFYPGGHGPMEDLAVNAGSGALLVAALASGKPLGIVCHGPAALLATADAEGGSPFAGRRVTAFSNAEETQSGFADRAPWLLQDRLVALGVDFQEGEAWAPHVIADGNLYTGQNPASAAPLAARIVTALG
ncbi:type 1 glutamine amidotransferase domain-containing protein [Streptomyces flavofungini]|uniref:Type 1 glutamine amidotransferase domain-containing protein n=1 Tax=Streptomyces flavofungini TaxID=68200 RepID=A0ABS0XFB3_9ACTN|nr:type 1 glutamine amidotransferase domain-containing protein [Streptomyces flavofungini]MBJ3811919.1 type 1 glutamine amidotransferase domain-containing protein [Streptomyces flavofungini]GHC52428.1 dimethylallyltransferase [Streptomyces flavofungini]